jgi:V8-like Glu-specific endopeptidase
MKRAPILALLVLILAVGALPVAAITWGEVDGEDHPYVGLLAAYKAGEYQWRCSGTLINEQVFLTAGHCLEDGVDSVRIWFASEIAAEDYPDGGDYVVGTPVLHPAYEWGGSNPHDVGVVVLDEPVDSDLAMLPDPDLLTQLKKDRVLRPGGPEGTKFVVVGYGGTLSWPPPAVDYSLKIRQWAVSEYVALTKPWLHMSQLSLKGDGGTCGGDSGGPAFWVDENGNDIVVAVTSWGDPYCIATGFNYRVDVPEILDWIYRQFPDD